MIEPFLTQETALVAIIVAAGGFVRGVTGFGGAMAIGPAASAILGPVPAIVLALAMEVGASAAMAGRALKRADRGLMARLCLAAVLTIPLGGLALAYVDPELMKRVIAGAVLVSTALMASGLRWRGPRRPAYTIGVGGVAGVMVGAIGFGAPPVILYLLSGDEPVAVTRANLILFVTALSSAGLAMLIASGLAAAPDAIRAALLAPVYLAAAFAGSRVFAGLDAARFRNLALALLAAAALAAMLA